MFYRCLLSPFRSLHLKGNHFTCSIIKFILSHCLWMGNTVFHATGSCESYSHCTSLNFHCSFTSLSSPSNYTAFFFLRLYSTHVFYLNLLMSTKISVNVTMFCIHKKHPLSVTIWKLWILNDLNVTWKMGISNWARLLFSVRVSKSLRIITKDLILLSKRQWKKK